MPAGKAGTLDGMVCLLWRDSDLLLVISMGKKAGCFIFYFLLYLWYDIDGFGSFSAISSKFIGGIILGLDRLFFFFLYIGLYVVGSASKPRCSH